MEQKPKGQESDYLPKRGNPLQETVCYRLSGTVYEVCTSCCSTELLYDKMYGSFAQKPSRMLTKTIMHGIIRTATC